MAKAKALSCKRHPTSFFGPSTSHPQHCAMIQVPGFSMNAECVALVSLSFAYPKDEIKYQLSGHADNRNGVSRRNVNLESHHMIQVTFQFARHAWMYYPSMGGSIDLQVPTSFVRIQGEDNEDSSFQAMHSVPRRRMTTQLAQLSDLAHRKMLPGDGCAGLDQTVQVGRDGLLSVSFTSSLCGLAVLRHLYLLWSSLFIARVSCLS